MGDPLGVEVDVLGTAVTVRAPAAMIDEVRAALVDLPLGQGPRRQVALVESDDGLALVDDGEVVRRAVPSSVAVATVVWHLNAIAAESQRYVLLHAGCVADDAGGAVVLPGRSGAGKSTLTLACVEAGLAYLSDELTAIDSQDGALVPYPRPLGIGSRLVPVSTMASGAVASATAPAAIVFPRFEPGADVHAVRLDPVWTLIALAAHAPNLAIMGAVGLAWLAGLATACPASQVTYGEARLAVPVVRRAAEASAGPLAPAAILPPVTADTTAVEIGRDLAVLHHPTGRVHVLNASAAFVWRSCADRDDARNALAAALAEADVQGLDSTTATATVDHLVRSGLLDPGRLER